MFRPLLIVIALVATACAGAPTVTPAPTAAPTAPAQTAAAGATVSLASAGYFVGPNGMTLYTFDNDSPGATSCSGDCLVNWPALIVTSAGAITLGSGLVATDFAVVTRPEGPAQVMFKQIPLYYFAGDTAPGQTNGDGVGGIWHLATSASTLPTAAPPTAAATATAAAPTVPATGGPLGIMIGTDVSGTYLVTPDGFSLYIFDNDSPGESSCNGDCAGNWPPFPTGGMSFSGGAGVSGTFGEITRDDGIAQLTYNDAPIYFYSGDNAAGETNGDGIGDVWHLAKP